MTTTIQAFNPKIYVSPFEYLSILQVETLLMIMKRQLLLLVVLILTVQASHQAPFQALCQAQFQVPVRAVAPAMVQALLPVAPAIIQVLLQPFLQHQASNQPLNVKCGLRNVLGCAQALCQAPQALSQAPFQAQAQP